MVCNVHSQATESVGGCATKSAMCVASAAWYIHSRTVTFPALHTTHNSNQTYVSIDAKHLLRTWPAPALVYRATFIKDQMTTSQGLRVDVILIILTYVWINDRHHFPTDRGQIGNHLGRIRERDLVPRKIPKHISLH